MIPGKACPWARAQRLGIALVAVLAASRSEALQPRTSGQPAAADPAVLEVAPSLVIYNAEAARGAAAPQAMTRFLSDHPGRWEVRWDTRNERPHLVQGVGVPLLPGRGNTLTGAQVGLSGRGSVRLEDVERLVRGFMARYPEMFRVAPESLRLDRSRSVAYGPEDRVWFVELQQYQQGVPVLGAKVFFRVSNGNVVQFGADRIAEVGIGVQPALDAREAMQRGLDAMGASVSDVAETLDAGTLAVLPILTDGERLGEPYAGLAGFGYDHLLAWESTIRRRSDGATYALTVDAHTGALLRAQDVDRSVDAKVTGGIYPVTNSDAEVVKGLPYVAVKNGPTKYTNASGLYDYTSGSAASSALNGQYIQVVDGCGAISLSNPSAGTLAFGSSGGADCATPGVGGAGNTHAARNAFYHLTKLNRRASTFLPGNPWLDSKLVVNTNAAGTCNAVWNGTTASFYRSGGGCTNAGEISSILFHEWGHGLDDNTGGPSSDGGTGEAVGDTFAFLQTRDGCIGRNLAPGVDCYNCQACTGVRDVADFSTSGPAIVAKASTAKDNAGMDCDRFACNGPFHGPLGYEGHCESYIASSANWDLAQSLVSTYGTDPGWGHMETLWYRSLTAGKSAYRVASGGTGCNTAATTDGCLADNWYSVDLAANDDDGNLANGTPDACRIWAAFNAHGMACGAQPPCSGTGGPTPTPTPTALPTATLTPTPTPMPTATPTPSACGGTTVAGFLSFGGDFDYWPDSSGFTSVAGTQVGMLHGTSLSEPDFDLYLNRSTDGGATWSNVAQSIGVTDDELITYAGMAGRYRWRVYSWSGSGNYTFCYSHP